MIQKESADFCAEIFNNGDSWKFQTEKKRREKESTVVLD